MNIFKSELLSGYDAHRILSHGLCNVRITGSSFFLDVYISILNQTKSILRLKKTSYVDYVSGKF